MKNRTLIKEVVPALDSVKGLEEAIRYMEHTTQSHDSEKECDYAVIIHKAAKNWLALQQQQGD